MNGVVKNLFCGFGRAILFVRDCVVQISRDREPRNLGNFVSSDAPGGANHDPVIDGELALLLFEKLLKVSLLSSVSVKPSVILDLNNFSERFVLRELAVDALEIDLMVLKDLKETFHSNFVPPVVLFEDKEAPAKDVANVGATTNVGRKAAVRDGHKERTGVVQNDVKLLHILHRVLYGFDVLTDLCCNVSPGLVNVFHLVDVKSAGDRSKLFPNLNIVRDFKLGKKVTHGVGESIGVGGGRAICEPGKSFQANTDINNFNIKLFA